jgi:hypothetical protein
MLCLTVNLLTWRIWWAPNNASRWQMGFNSAFKGRFTHSMPCPCRSPAIPCPHTAMLCLTVNLLTWRIWWAPNNASRWDLTRRLKGQELARLLEKCLPHKGEKRLWPFRHWTPTMSHLNPSSNGNSIDMDMSYTRVLHIKVAYRVPHK